MANVSGSGIGYGYGSGDGDGSGSYCGGGEKAHFKILRRSHGTWK